MGVILPIIGMKRCKKDGGYKREITGFKKMFKILLLVCIGKEARKARRGLCIDVSWCSTLVLGEFSTCPEIFPSNENSLLTKTRKFYRSQGVRRHASDGIKNCILNSGGS